MEYANNEKEKTKNVIFPKIKKKEKQFFHFSHFFSTFFLLVCFKNQVENLVLIFHHSWFREIRQTGNALQKKLLFSFFHKKEIFVHSLWIVITLWCASGADKMGKKWRKFLKIQLVNNDEWRKMHFCTESFVFSLIESFSWWILASLGLFFGFLEFLQDIKYMSTQKSV